MKKQNLIVIFTDKYDYSSLKVAEYLQYWGEKVIRINPEDTSECDFNITIANNNHKSIQLSINGIPLDCHNIKSIWFRRGGLSFKKIEKREIKKDTEILYRQINEYFSSEQKTLNEFIYTSFIDSKIKVLGNPFIFNTNKLTVLNKATLYGLEIPYTLITTKNKDVNRLVKQKKELITKAIQDNFTPALKEEAYGLRTEIVDKEILSGLPSSLFPSLFQEKLDKKFDLRIFYLDGAFFSMAIHSQDNEKTTIDFRNYDNQNPNRKSIFNLPYKIKSKLKALLQDLRLNTASIDMVYTINNRYVFLEINPVGQYDMVGKPMNFHLDKKIALWLAAK